MKKFLFYIVKYVKWIYQLYFYLGSFALKVLKLFVRPDDKLILFISFGGRRFDDSPKAIYDSMIKDIRFDDYQFVWAFNHPEKYNISRGNKIKDIHFTPQNTSYIYLYLERRWKLSVYDCYFLFN